VTISIDQVIDADVVDRVACPTCHQRRCVDLECNCCRGCGYVDCDQVYDVVGETLSDCCFGRGGIAPCWLPSGLYTVVGGSYLVMGDRTVDYVTDEQMTIAHQTAESRKRPSLLSRLFAWVLNG
jgi:hypothetical protein